MALHYRAMLEGAPLEGVTRRQRVSEVRGDTGKHAQRGRGWQRRIHTGAASVRRWGVFFCLCGSSVSVTAIRVVTLDRSFVSPVLAARVGRHPPFTTVAKQVCPSDVFKVKIKKSIERARKNRAKRQ